MFLSFLILSFFLVKPFYLFDGLIIAEDFFNVNIFYKTFLHKIEMIFLRFFRIIVKTATST